MSLLFTTEFSMEISYSIDKYQRMFDIFLKASPTMKCIKFIELHKVYEKEKGWNPKMSDFYC